MLSIPREVPDGVTRIHSLRQEFHETNYCEGKCRRCVLNLKLSMSPRIDSVSPNCVSDSPCVHSVPDRFYCDGRSVLIPDQPRKQNRPRSLHGRSMCTRAKLMKSICLNERRLLRIEAALDVVEGFRSLKFGICESTAKQCTSIRELFSSCLTIVILIIVIHQAVTRPS